MSKFGNSPSKIITHLENNIETLNEVYINDNGTFKINSEEYCKKIGEALKKNTFLKKLSLKNLEIDDECLNYLCEGLSQNNTLEVLDLQENCITRLGVEQLATTMKENTSMKEITLTGHKTLSHKTAQCWGECLKSNFSLQKLNCIFPAPYRLMINKLLSRNIEIQRRKTGGKDFEHLVQPKKQVLENSIPNEKSPVEKNLHQICDSSPIDIKELREELESKKFQVNGLDSAKNTALHILIANHAGSLEAVELLVSHGADVNAENGYNNTPLHLACGNANHTKIALFLLKNGANVNIKNKSGV